MEVPMKRLVRKLDNDGNSILHTIRRKIKDFVSDEKMKGPAFLSQEELLCVEKFTPSHFLNHESTKKLTAEEFFVAANCELLDLARERLKITVEGCSVVAVLIATVAFAAAYTAPGGSNQSTGVPVLNKPLFVCFRNFKGQESHRLLEHGCKFNFRVLVTGPSFLLFTSDSTFFLRQGLNLPSNHPPRMLTT
ncbi:hypothetical protein OIU78_000043 [Salix suchowensis]|nr:hypothetical protein OIU78_000043 [Salix suchowensis]